MRVRRAHLVRAVLPALSCAAALSAPVTPSFAEDGARIDCQAANLGGLDLTIGPGGTTAREIALNTGDKLTVAVHVHSGVDASVTLISENGVEQSLLWAQDASKATFRSPRDEVVSLRFEVGDASAATFLSVCDRAGKDVKVERRAARLMASNRQEMTVPLDADVTAESAVLAIERPPIRLSDPGATHIRDGQGPAQGLAAGTGVDMWLQWRDQRFAVGGPEGPLMDSGRDGMNIGASYKLMPEIMVGALTQFGQIPETTVGAPASLSERPWLIGPTTTVQFAPGLSFDARAAWGGGDAASATATAIDRKLVNARFANVQTFGAWRLAPSVGFNYAQETRHGTILEHGEAGSDTIASGRIDLGPEIAYRIPLEGSAFIEPKAVISRYWDIGPDATAHLKAEAGLAIGTGDGTQLQATGGVDSGAGDVRDVWSGRLQFNMPLK